MEMKMEMEIMTVTLTSCTTEVINLRCSQQQHGGQLSGSFISRRIRPIYRHWVALVRVVSEYMT